jgi:hypothetical protein
LRRKISRDWQKDGVSAEISQWLWERKIIAEKGVGNREETKRIHCYMTTLVNEIFDKMPP